jgi:hypothetical protein
MRNFLFLMFFIALLTSCAVYNGSINGSASLTQGNFRYINHISGKATTTYFLFIGGLSHNALVNEAREDMLKHNPLKENQALANITIDWKNSNILLFRRICTISADVIEFTDKSSSKDLSTNQINNKSIGNKTNKNTKAIDSNHFNIGDTVIIKQSIGTITGTIKKIENDKYYVSYFNKITNKDDLIIVKKKLILKKIVDY